MNSQHFDRQQIATGLMNQLLDFLMSESYAEGSKYYNDIHIIPTDCGAFTVEWEQVPWSHEFGGSFKYVSDDEVVVIEKQLPDNSFQYFIDEEEYREVLNEYLKENPYYKQDQHGIWYDERDQVDCKEINR